MALEGVSSGAASSSSGMSVAEKLQQRHEAEDTHHATVEDAVDEDDLAHPPPSMRTPTAPDASEPVTKDANLEGQQSRSTEKHKTDPEPKVGLSRNEGPKHPAINTQSHEAFPSLGGAARTPAPAPTSTAWSNKPSSVRNQTNGVNGSISSLPSSGSTTPFSGALTPTSSTTSVRPSSQGLSFPQKMQMPGKHTERIQFAPSQLRPARDMRKPLAEVVRDINKRSKANVEMKNGGNGTVIFESRGPFEATRQALKDLAREVGSKQHTKVTVPISVRPHIIGRQGTTIQNIQKQTGARIHLPKGDDVASLSLEDEDGMIDVSIEGDACAAEQARQAIELIAKERASSVQLSMRDIAPELFPFIAGPHNSRLTTLEEGRQIQITVPHYHTWSDQGPPQAADEGLMPKFTPSPSHAIRIAGDRAGAQEARKDIERIAQQLQQQIALAQMQIEQGRHQFILDDESSLNDFLRETGCAVILPPRSVDTETLTVTGPPERIEAAKDRIYDLVSAMHVSQIDIAKQHPSPLGADMHALALTRYLQQHQAFAKLEQQYNARIVLPHTEHNPGRWEIYGKDGRSAMRAKQDVLNLVTAHPPSRVRHVQVDPFLHQHVHEHTAGHLRENFKTHMLEPTPSSNASHLVLIYEGVPFTTSTSHQLPAGQPTPSDIAEFERNLELAERHILEIIADQSAIQSVPVNAPLKYHDKIRRFVRREQQDLPPWRVPAQVIFEDPGQRVQNLPENHGQSMLRGPGDLNDFAAKIADFVAAEERDEIERNHITTVDFPQQRMNFLIGRRGENVNRLRDEFDVDINTKEGKVDIIGPKAKAEKAKASIINMGNKLQDERQHVLIIPSQYHRDIIGAKGTQVNRLQDRYSVRIHFPRSGNLSSDAPDDASEVSAPKSRRPLQGPNEVIVKGPSRGADSARDELLSLLRYTQDNSHAGTVSVAQKQLPSLIGSGGQEMEALRLSTGAQIDVPSKDSVDAEGRVIIRLKGTKKQVEEVKRILEQKAKVFDNTIIKNIDVDRRHHKSLIGPGGSNIRSIVLAAGGSDDRRELAKTVRFPKQGVENDTITIEGSKEVVDKIIEAIRTFDEQSKSQVTEVMVIPPEKHRLLIGHGGETRRGLETKFKVVLKIPRMTDEGPSRSEVKLTGQPAEVAKAKMHIKGLTEDVAGETVDVPRRHHHTVAENGQFFRRLRNNHNVTVHHGDQRAPPKLLQSPPPEQPITSMPLITDDSNDKAAHAFTLADRSAPSTEEGTIPWILNGSPENIVKARAALERALTAAESEPSMATGRLLLSDPSKYRFVIGQGGSKINEIRAQTGCKITVPREHNNGEPVEIVGTKEGVEKARDIILEVVSHGGRRA